MNRYFNLLDQMSMLFLYENRKKKFVVIFSSPRLRLIKASNLTTGWVQYRSKRETRDSEAVTSIQGR